MGLDTVEIVLRVEETFGVDLPDDELGSVRTVGDLHELLLRKLDGGYACLSSRAFYRVRKALVDVLGVKRNSVRPSSELAVILDQRSRPNVWREIEQQSGLRFPRLEHPGWFNWTAFLLCLSIYASVCAIMAPIFFHDFPHPISGLTAIAFPFSVALILIPLGMVLLRKATPFLGFVLPVATVGELARDVLAKNYPQLRQGDQKGENPDRNEIWLIVQDIFIDQLQVKREEVVPEANIARDLGCE